MKKVIYLFHGVICLALVAASSAFATTDATTVEQDAGITQNLDHRVDLDLLFKDQDGKEVKLRDAMLPNRPTILTPVYYGCPRICTLTLNGLVKTLNELDLKMGEDFQVISFSFNPEEDSDLAALKAANYYQELSDKDRGPKGWRFLVGGEESIRRLAEQIGFRYKRDGVEYIHAAAVLVLTPDGRIARYFPGVEYPSKDVRISLVDASEGRIGGIADQVFLFCFRYDHLTGKYTLAAWNLMRVVCTTFAAAIAIFLILLRRKELAEQERNA